MLARIAGAMTGAGLWRYGLNSLVHLILPVVGLEVRAGAVGRRRQLAFQHDHLITSPQLDLTNTAALRLFV
jgi:hypothetical protein